MPTSRASARRSTIAYDETARTLTYQAEGLPAFLGTARNQWRVEAIDDQHTRVRLEATLHVQGVLGRLAYLVLRLQLTRTAPRFLDDLKYYVEHHRPSPRKQRAEFVAGWDAAAPETGMRSKAQQQGFGRGAAAD